MFNLDDYEPVDVRTARFWEKYPEGKIETDLVFNDGKTVIFKCSVYRNDGTLIATGYADETISDSGVNKNFHIPNAETSSIGRALAAAGFQAKIGKKMSREEAAKVNRVAEPPVIMKAGTTHIAGKEPDSKDVWTISDAIGAVTETIGAVVTETRPKCKHGERTYLSGTSPKTNKAYKGYMCPEKVKAQQCEPVWVN
jgi:hypothetical protein